ncbi:helix-turn-helix transcriptional regulator [Peribacillus sp. NPDC006672]|uniref:helix-turn-helix transcriptional regulator n=1 Tax=Peribacillus sp. NPDC006672 TaxID=3390606 RepID=UPI003D0274C9
MKFENWLRNKRESQGYTQMEVAKYLNITREGVSKWENGKTRPSLEMLTKLFRLFNCTKEEISELFDGIENGLEK